MIKIKLLFGSLFYLCNFYGYGQEGHITKTLAISVAPYITFHSDTKFSEVASSGVGAMLGLHYLYRKEDRYTFKIELLGGYSNPSAPVVGSIYNQFTGLLYLDYQRKISSSWHLGLRVYLFDIFYQHTNYVENNSTYINERMSIGAIVKYDFESEILDGLSIKLHYGLISYMKEQPSFGFSSSQTRLEQGKYTYDSDDFSLRFKYYNFVPFWEQVQLQIFTQWQFSQRFAIYYLWQYRYQEIVNKYPTINGFHSLGIAYSL